MPIYKYKTITLGCNMLKASLPDHQTINMVLRKHNYFVCSNMHSLHAHHLVKYVVLSSWNINTNQLICTVL